MDLINSIIQSHSFPINKVPHEQAGMPWITNTDNLGFEVLIREGLFKVRLVPKSYRIFVQPPSSKNPLGSITVSGPSSKDIKQGPFALSSLDKRSYERLAQIFPLAGLPSYQDLQRLAQERLAKRSSNNI